MNINDTNDINDMNNLSILYKDSLYETELFDIFKDVTIFEKYHTRCYNKGENVDNKLRKEFVIKIHRKIMDFILKYDNMIVFDLIRIKNRIMIISILRKLIKTVKNSSDYFIKFNMNDDILYYKHFINQIFS